MEIVSEDIHRVLAYVDALNRHGINPPALFVDRFAEAPDYRRRTVLRKSFVDDTAAILAGAIYRSVVDAGESFTSYLERLGWATLKGRGVELSPIGRALIKALNTPAMEDAATNVFEIVLTPENPFAYAQALGAMSTVHDAMLVEPYFRLEQLMDIGEFGNIARVLLGYNLKPHEYELLATGLASLPSARNLELRKAKTLHDRYLIPAHDGGVLMLGMSLGGIGKKVSTLTTLGAEASQALRGVYETIWNDADVIKPKTPPATATGDTAIAVGVVTPPPAATATTATKKVAKKTTKKA
jgi:hypothetical protein